MDVGVAKVVLRRQVEVHLKQNAVGEDGALANGRTIGLAPMRALHLHSNHVSAEGAATIVERHHARRLSD